MLTAHVCSARAPVREHQCVNTCACTLQVHAAKELEAFHGSTTALISSFFFAPSDLAAAGGGAGGAAEGAAQGKPSFDSTMQAYQPADAAGAAAAGGAAAAAAAAVGAAEGKARKTTHQAQGAREAAACYEVACCDADHRGAWEGAWEACEIVAEYWCEVRREKACDVQIAEDGELCFAVPRRLVRRKCLSPVG